MNKHKQLVEMLATLDPERVTRDEFIKILDSFTTFMETMFKKNEKEFLDIHQSVAELKKQVKEDTSNDTAEMRATLKTLLSTEMSKIMAQHDAKMKEVDDKIDSLQDGEDGDDGKDADAVQIVQDVLAQIKLSEQKEAILDDAPIILAMQKQIDDLKALIQRVGNARGHSGGGIHPMKFKDLSSQTNGTLKIFAVPKSVNAVVFTSDFPYVLIENNGFTLDAARTKLTLTVANAPSQSSQLLYQYNSPFNTTT